MKLLTITFFMHLCASFTEICGSNHKKDGSRHYSTVYKNQDLLDKTLVRKVKNEKTFAVTINVLLGLKANPNAIDKKGRTAFSFLFSPLKPCIEKINLFLKHNVDCNKMSVFTREVCLTSSFQSLRVEEALLEYIFKNSQHVDIIPFIKLFLDHKADPNRLTSKGTTLLHNVLHKMKAYKYPNGDPVSLIKDIINHKGDVNIRNQYGSTPFHVLCSENDYNELISYFLEARGDANIKNRSEMTPFKYFLNNHTEVCDIDRNVLNAFIECNVDLRYLLEISLGRDERAYHYHSEETLYDKKEVLDFIFFLLEKKADLNAIPRYGLSNVYYQERFTSEIIKRFLRYGMDPTIDIGYQAVEFGYEYAANKSKDKRNVLAYAIPSFIMQKHVQKWETLLLCLHLKKKLCPAFNLPRYLRIALCGRVVAKINEVLKGIQRIEKDDGWPRDKNEVFSLKNNICELIDMSDMEL